MLQEDKPWDWDRLFTEVTSELFTQTEQTEENDIGDQVLPWTPAPPQSCDNLYLLCHYL